MGIKPLCETDLYVLFSKFEHAFLFDKNINKQVWQIDLFGDPTCGVISLSNAWVIVGGERLIVWRNDKLNTIDDNDLHWIYDIRQVEENKVEILTDPWTANSAIWLFDIYTEMKVKIRDFRDYQLREYTEDVKW